MPHAPFAAVLLLILLQPAPGLAGSAVPAAASPVAAPAAIDRQPGSPPALGWEIDWRSLQDIVLDRLHEDPIPTGTAAPAAAGPMAVQCLTMDGSCSLNVAAPVAFGMPCRCDGSDAPGTTR